MSTPGEEPSKTLDECATLRARVVELQRENDVLKQAEWAHTEAEGDLQTSGTVGTPELGSLQEIYGAAPIGLCCLDTKLRYVFINEWLAEINGLSVEEHLGRPISEVLPDVAAGVEAQLRGVMETGEPVVGGTVVAETAAQPGVKRNFEHHYDAVRSADGAIVGVSCVVQDVTERKRAEEALRLAHEQLEDRVRERTEELLAANKSLQESEERLSLTLESINEGVWDWNIATGEVFYSPQWCKLLGFDPSEVEPHVSFWERLLHPDDQPRVMEALNDHLQGKTDVHECEARLRTKSGEYRWNLDRGKVVARDEDGKPLRMVGVDVDITERKQADEALKEREQHFRLFSLSTGDCFWNWDMVAGTVERSSGFERAFGYREQEIRSDIEWWGDRIHPEDKERVWKVFDAAVAGDQSICGYEYRFRCQDGSYAVVVDHVCLIRDATGKVVHSLGAMRDITERKRAEADLRESEALFHGLAETIKEVLFVVDHDPCDLLYVSRAYEEVWGRTCKSLYEQPHSWEDTVVSDDRECVDAGLERQQHTGEFDEEFRIRRPDGSVRWIHGRVVPILCEGKPLRSVGLAEDITERKRAEEALSASERRFRTTFESAAIAMALDDEQGRFIETNVAFQKMFGYSAQELEGMTISELTYPADPDRGWELFRELIEGQRDSFHLEKRYYRKDRTLLWGSVSVSAIRNADGSLRHTVAMVEDITARKRAEERARQLQADLAHMSRLSSMGEMATGLAHELNQPLTAIANYAQGCVRRLKSNAISQEELEGILGRIATQARRSSSIIRSLGNLVRKSSALRTDTDVNQSIMDVAELANAEAAQHRVKARFELEPNLPPVKADQTQLQQVILNLVQNGCEAIDDAPQSRREVTVRTKQRDDSYLEIIVSDCGAGIPERLSERLFEPFVTTKAHGIGMGLAISRSIVESHGGRLWATPNPDQGTTFHFTLPFVGGGSVDE